MIVEENSLTFQRVPRSVVYRFFYVLQGRQQQWSSGDFADVQSHARAVLGDGATDGRFEVECFFDTDDQQH
ncbi:hypothetical protein [Acidovorax cavernicola]|uniref:hypothetical protein n=1 Tax=Acidovorax cavernicola TaxID=1675792 RepID=UPI0011C370AB|nr:hypothetical protein [Acidovorax cavernicola]